MKKVLFILLLICSNQLLFSQTYKYTKQFTQEDKKQFLGLTKEVFKLNSFFSAGISDSDTEMSISDIKDQLQYDKSYLEKIKAALKKDSLNPYYLNDMAMYHEANQDMVSAKRYFQKAMKNLPNLFKTKKDSARFYSLRGVLKIHLQEKDAVADIEKAFKVNPLDSLANAFYPIFLIGERRYADAKQFSMKKLDADQLPKQYYVMLYMSYFGEIQTLLMDEAQKGTNRKKEYDALVDYSLLDTYAEKYKDNIQIRNARNIIEVSALFFKMALFELDKDKSGFVLNFSEREKKKISALITFFTDATEKGMINPFTGNKSLALLYYMQNKPDMVAQCAKKAIAILPFNKQTVNFNNTDSYSLILNVYSAQKAYAEYQKVIEEKIEKGYDKSGLATDYLDMAILNLYRNDVTKAEEWCRKSKALNADKFECLRLLSHIYFLNDNLSLSQYYGESAARKITSQDESSRLSLQFAIYMIANGDQTTAKTAYDNIVEAKKALDGDCRLCDDLLAKFIKVSP
jgi:hypothetical protein